MVEKVSAISNGATKTSDFVATILKVKELASEVGGLKKLRALVDVLEGKQSYERIAMVK